MSDTQVNRRIQTACLLILAAFAIGVALFWLRPVMIPFVLAVLLSYVLAPLMNVQTERLRLPRSLALVLTLAIGFLILTAAGMLISGSVRQLARNAHAYQEQVTGLAQAASEWLAAQGYEVGTETLSKQIAAAPVGSVLVRVTNAVIDTLSNTFLVLVFAIYLLQGAGRTHEPSAIALEIDRKIKRYVNLKIALSAVTGVLVGLILKVLGVELAMVFGVLAFVLNFIPSVGSVVATLLPVPLILVSPGFSGTTLVLALVLPGIVQMVVGNMLEPKLMGESLGLHPITVLLALILWGMLWGIAGMLLAAPMTAVARILLDSLDITKPVARAMAGDLGMPG